jgi:hypothetical protein
MGLSYEEIMNRVANASVSERRPGLDVGNYRLSVDTLKMFEGRNAITWFCAEVTVLTSNTDLVPVGSRRAWLQDMTKEVSHSNVKGFFLALMPDMPEDQYTGQVLMNLVDEKNPAQGSTVQVGVEHRMSKNSGREYKHFSWMPSAVVEHGEDIPF